MGENRAKLSDFFIINACRTTAWCRVVYRHVQQESFHQACNCGQVREFSASLLPWIRQCFVTRIECPFYPSNQSEQYLTVRLFGKAAMKFPWKQCRALAWTAQAQVTTMEERSGCSPNLHSDTHATHIYRSLYIVGQKTLCTLALT